jgi:hypothetical protein
MTPGAEHREVSSKKEHESAGILNSFFGKTFTVFNLLLSVVFLLKIALEHEGEINNLKHAVSIAKNVLKFTELEKKVVFPLLFWCSFHSSSPFAR